MFSRSMPVRRRRQYLTAAALLAASGCDPASAGRAFELNGFSAVSIGMGGAGVAVANDTEAVNYNPAGLTQVSAHAANGYLYPYDSVGISHADALGNDAHTDTPFGAVLAGSYAQRLAVLPDVVFGVGLFAQGGAGLGYNSLKTSFDTTDELSSNFGVFKLVSGFGWRVNEQLSLGASVGVSYAQGREKFFPETSNAASSFFGLRFDSGETVVPNFQLGVQYHPAPEWTLAVAYTSKTPLPLTGGRITVDFDAIGLGQVNYRHARLNGLALPQEGDIGLAYKPDPRWLLSLQVDWLDYSGALRASTLLASQPDNSSAPSSIDAASPLHWRNEYVFAAGAAYNLGERNILRGGFNIENNPIPRTTLSPVLNLAQQREITLGFGHKFDYGWAFDFSFEYQPQVSQAYSNSALPLGASAREHYQVTAATLELSRRW